MAEDQETAYVTLRSANYDSEYASKFGNKSPRGAVLEVPVEVAKKWKKIGLARPANATETKDYKDWLEERFAERDEDEEMEPDIFGTPAQRAAQEQVNIRNRPVAQRPTGAQIGNAPATDSDKDA